jgi:hypothetical protein
MDTPRTVFGEMETRADEVVHRLSFISRRHLLLFATLLFVLWSTNKT